MSDPKYPELAALWRKLPRRFPHERVPHDDRYWQAAVPGQAVCGDCGRMCDVWYRNSIERFERRDDDIVCGLCVRKMMSLGIEMIVENVRLVQQVQPEVHWWNR